MTQASETFEALCSRNLAGPAELLFGGWPDNEGRAVYRRVTIGHTLAAQLNELVERWRSDAREVVNDVGLRHFDSAPQPDDVSGVQYLSLDRDSFLRGAVGSLPEPVDATGWTAEDPEVGTPRSIVVVVHMSGDVTARFFRRHTPSKQLVKPGKLVAIARGNRFDSLEESSAMLISYDFDCAQFGNHLYVTSATGFETLFGYTVSIRNNAMVAVDSLVQYLDPTQVDGFRNSVSGSVRAMKRMAGRIQLDLSTVDHRKVRRVVQEWGFNVVVGKVGGRVRLGFQGGDPTDLIKLLTDSAVKSAITDKKFIATAKTEI